MTTSRGSPPEGPDGSDACESLIKRLVRLEASHEVIADVAMRGLERLLLDEHLQMAVLHVCDHEAYWDDGRKLEILGRFRRAGMDAYAIMLCHRWKLSALLDKKDHRLYRELFPKLPPRTDKKERP